MVSPLDLRRGLVADRGVPASMGVGIDHALYFSDSNAIYKLVLV